MPVPNIFGTATAAIPLSQLDQNFATAITLGNTAVYLGNTTTSLGNLTLTNVTISSGTSNIAANVSTAVGLLPEAQGGTGTTTGYYGFKSRIINGSMVIDQRNAGASITANNNVFAVDRFKFQASQTAKGTLQQSTTAPVGFINSLLFTSSSAYSITSTDFFVHAINIEGLNVADLAWGTASAAAVTFSFWVRSSLTGTFGGVVQNSASDRSYPFTYTISAANTFEQKTITIAGDTSGTWLKTNGTGIRIYMGLGVGATYSGTAGAWAGANYIGATGATSVVGTNGATFYITGVQLEKGSTATSFDYRPYGTELALCQRYYQTNSKLFSSGSALNAYFYYDYTPFIVTMRATPSTLTFTTSAYVTPSGTTNATLLLAEVGYFVSYPTNTNAYSSSNFTWTASAEL
jgi:hypothetical protein